VRLGNLHVSEFTYFVNNFLGDERIVKIATLRGGSVIIQNCVRGRAI
jgi:hypothetical protein